MSVGDSGYTVYILRKNGTVLWAGEESKCSVKLFWAVIGGMKFGKG